MGGGFEGRWGLGQFGGALEGFCGVSLGMFFAGFGIFGGLRGGGGGIWFFCLLGSGFFGGFCWSLVALMQVVAFIVVAFSFFHFYWRLENRWYTELVSLWFRL